MDQVGDATVTGRLQAEPSQNTYQTEDLEEQQELLYKVLVIGDFGVGK